MVFDQKELSELLDTFRQECNSQYEFATDLHHCEQQSSPLLINGIRFGIPASLMVSQLILVVS